ncbi:hypothetical protein BGW80DRAFT_1458569 [Lactifluus volemus]|nr:hypothetical protein BGW80DRAFT_1458569 [Lactifluus volemus]
MRFMKTILALSFAALALAAPTPQDGLAGPVAVEKTVGGDLDTVIKELELV